jgi:uncharacterized protein (TIGR00369 family)
VVMFTGRGWSLEDGSTPRTSTRGVFAGTRLTSVQAEVGRAQGVGERSRSYEWSDPLGQAEWVRSRSGAEFLEAWQRGDVTPPIAATLDFSLASFGDGRAEIVCTPGEFHFNPLGMVHGGLIATLLDTATACAVHTRLDAGTGYATLGLSVDYLRPVTIDTGPIRCIGSVVSMGRRVAVADGRIIDGADRLLARGSATCLIIDAAS